MPQKNPLIQSESFRFLTPDMAVREFDRVRQYRRPKSNSSSLRRGVVGWNPSPGRGSLPNS